MNLEEIPRFSASQISCYVDCARKWGFKSIEKIPDPGTKYTSRGLDVHEVAEKFLINGVQPDKTTDAGSIFLAGLKHLPVPGTCAGVEVPFHWFPENEPFSLSGRIDWIEENPLTVCDHKTTSSFDWAMSEEQLSNNIQAILYASYLLDVSQEKEIMCKWVYYLTTARRGSRKVQIKFTKEDLKIKFEPILETCREMSSRIVKREKATEMPYNTNGCEKYGGCPYREICGLTSIERFRSTMTQLSLKEKLAMKAQKPAEVNPPEQNVVQAKQEPVAQTEAVKPMSIKEKLAAKQSSQPVAQTEQPKAAEAKIAPFKEMSADKKAEVEDVVLAYQMIEEGLLALIRHLKKE